jgi:hypothetical protein
MNNPKILVLSRNQHHHFKPLIAKLPYELVETEDWDQENIVKINPSILLTLTFEWYEADKCIRKARERGIPTLLLMDGIMEWRLQWEDPKTIGNSGWGLFHLATVDKIACLGRQSVRQLEAWGNVGKCELVGCPRFDSYLENPTPLIPHEGPKRLLIMTANTPAYTSEQMDFVEKSLVDLNNLLKDKTEWVPIWRFGRRGQLKDRLNLKDNFSHLQGKPLSDVLKYADAVITTPSTTQLEAMLAQRPTALLDYSNSFHYVPAAWTITSSEHIETVLNSLFEPPHSRMLLQDEILHDCLECYSPATPRLIKLVEDMIDMSQKCRIANNPLHYPFHLLQEDDHGFVLPSYLFDLAKLYPLNQTFSNTDLVDLQRQLIFYKQENNELRRKASILGTIKETFSILLNKIAL